MADTPTAPEYLAPGTQAWWCDVLATYELDPHHVRSLTLAAESWDRGQQARQILDSVGITYQDRFGAPRARPEIAIERDCRLAFARLVRELALDLEPPEPASKPPIVGAG